MKYSTDITIDLPRDRVIELFDNPDNLAKWQPTLQSFEHVEGEPGQPGAKSRLTYRMGNRTIEMVETITERNLPDEFNGTYDAKGVHNIIKNRFVDKGDKTLWECENEFQFQGFMKLMGALMPGAFCKETDKHLRNFKEFAESQGA